MKSQSLQNLNILKAVADITPQMLASIFRDTVDSWSSAKV